MKRAFPFLVAGTLAVAGVRAAEQQFTTQAVKSDRLTLAPFARQDIPFNAGWTFTDGKGAKRTVDLPHDCQFEQPWVEKAGGARGFKDCGTKGVYENAFAYDPAWEGKRVYLEFEAIMSHGEVEVNGQKIGECDYGYLGCTLDVTDLLVKDRPNTVRVTCSTGSQRGSRWYTGGGLIRPVHIIVKSPVCVVEDGLFVKVRSKKEEGRSGGDWEALVQVQLDGYRGQGRKNELKILATIRDSDGKVVGTGETVAPWSKLRHPLVDLEPIAVSNPKLWDIETPNLYTCEVKLVLNGAEIDRVSDRFGFRTVEFGRDFGFRLNGRKVWLFGMANHHDLGALGAAAFDDGIRRMMRTVKRFGYNAIRCSHNPYSKGFYRIADEEGILVVDELYDKWGFSGGTWWIGSKTQRETWPQHMRRWLMRDRNHPSVILWSLGNEFQMNEDICGYDTDDWGVTTYRMMREYARRYDPTRLTTAAMFPSRAGGVGKNDPKELYNTYVPPELATVTDVSSFNYQPQAYADYLKCAPWMTLFQSEASTSEWLKPMNLMDRERMVGLCYWGAIEYWGESNRWPKKGWNYSFFNETLEPYPTAWLITSGAYPEKPIVRLGVLERGGEMTNWNEQRSGQDKIRENWTREPGSKAQVAVFSNRDEVELFLNGRSLGKRQVPRGATAQANVVWYRDVPWEPGELKAVGRGRSKSEEGRSAEHAIYSAGPVVRLKTEIDFEGEELVYARIVGVDAEGRENLSATGRVRVTVSGGGRLYALSNGDHATDELFTPDIDVKPLHDGTLQAIVRKTRGSKEPVRVAARFEASGSVAAETVTEKAPWGEVSVTVPSFPDRAFSIADFGGDANRAMASCAEAGGGRVVVPRGTWLSKGPIHFRSNCLLFLEEGAELRFSDNPRDYLPAVHTTWEGSECMNYSPLIYAYGCTNVGIAGKGKIHPVKKGWNAWNKRPPAHMRMTANLYHWMSTNAPVAFRDVTRDGGDFRPHLIQFNRSRNIVLRDYKIVDSPFWTEHLYLCRNVLVEGIDSYAHGNNNDGLDVEMTQDVIIRNCRFDQGDDGVVLKSGRNQDAWRLGTPTKNVVVRDCELVDGHGLLVVGSEMAGGVENVYMRDCRATGKEVLRMFYLKTNERRGGTLKHITMERCTAKHVRFGAFEIATDVLYQWAKLPTYEVRPTEIDDINMIDCTVESAERRYSVMGDRRKPIGTVRLRNVKVGNPSRESRAENVSHFIDEDD